MGVAYLGLAPPPQFPGRLRVGLAFCLMAACVRAGDEVDGSCSGEEEAAENREQQAVEVETLQSIFSEEITIIRKGAEFLVRGSRETCDRYTKCAQ